MRVSSSIHVAANGIILSFVVDFVFFFCPCLCTLIPMIEKTVGSRMTSLDGHGNGEDPAKRVRQSSDREQMKHSVTSKG